VSVLEGAERRFTGGRVDGALDALQRRSDELAILVGDEVQAVAQQVDDGVVEKAEFWRGC